MAKLHVRLKPEASKRMLPCQPVQTLDLPCNLTGHNTLVIHQTIFPSSSTWDKLRLMKETIQPIDPVFQTDRQKMKCYPRQLLASKRSRSSKPNKGTSRCVKALAKGDSNLLFLFRPPANSKAPAEGKGGLTDSL